MTEDRRKTRSLTPLALLLLLIVGGGSGTAIEILSPDKFTEYCAERIRAKVEAGSVETLVPLQLKLRHPKSGTSTIYLDAAYETYLTAPEKLDEIVEKYTASAVEALPAANALDASRIVPIIKPRTWLSEVGVAADPAVPSPVVYDSLNPELIVVYAENTPSSLSYFSPAELAEAKIDRQGLRQLAADNLVRLLPKIERRGEDGVYMVVAGGEFETSLLAVGTGWRQESFKVKGDFVFAAPSRGSLYITGSDDEAGIQTVRGYARTAYRDSAQKISPNLFVQRGGKLIVLPE